jgi:serine/threonine-protein kinase
MSADRAEDNDEVTKADNMVGQVLANRYQIEERLGEGAMGSVYKAKHVKVGRAFAVKLLHKRLLEDRKLTLRFEREAELAGRLRHPNVIGVVDVGETPDGFRYMVMDFAEGNDLATLLGEAPMTPERIVHLTRQMLEGLYHAHENGLIHRDFKPENVIIERDDHDTEVPRIVDFGIAILRDGGDGVNAAGRLTTNGLVLGTPHYMAPEQAVADPIDHRIDLFALGIVIYEMLCGKLPFDGTGAEVARANLLLDPPAIADRVPYLEVDPLLEAFARRLMSKKREQRPATAKVARELLDLITNDRPAAAVALGVPLVGPTRVPAVTQPVTPHRQGAYDPDIPYNSQPMYAASFEAPPASSPAIAMPAPARMKSEAHISTELSDPLTDGARRRTWLLAGLGGIVLAAIATVIIVKVSDSKSSEAEGAKIVMTATGPDQPHPGSDSKPTVIKPAVTEPAGSAVEPAGNNVAVEPPVVATGSAKKPPASTGRKPPKIDHTKGPGTIAAIGPGSAVEVKPPEPPKSANTTEAVYALFGAVGNDLRIARQARPGEAAVERIYQSIRRIQIQDATSSQAKRDETTALLNQLRAELAPLKKKP